MYEKVLILPGDRVKKKKKKKRSQYVKFLPARQNEILICGTAPFCPPETPDS